MKKFVYLLVSFVVIVSFQNCGNGELLINNKAGDSDSNQNTGIVVEVPEDNNPVDNTMPPESQSKVSEVRIHNLNTLQTYSLILVDLVKQKVVSLGANQEVIEDATSCFSQELITLNSVFEKVELCIKKNSQSGGPIACPTVVQQHIVDLKIGNEVLPFGDSCAPKYVDVCDRSDSLTIQNLYADFKSRAQTCLNTK